jgi:hypothetical protein
MRWEIIETKKRRSDSECVGFTIGSATKAGHHFPRGNSICSPF